MEPSFVINFDFFGITAHSAQLALELPAEVANHFRSRRIRAFENIYLVYPREYKVFAEVRRINLPQIEVNIIDWQRVLAPSPKIYLHWGLPERSKVSDALRIIGQFPITKIIIGATERSLAREISDHDKQRWERALSQACEITGSGWMPELELHQPLFKGQGLKLLCQEGIQANSPEEILKHHRLPNEISVLIGPEGGFTDSERKLANSNGWTEISLGRWNFSTEAAVFNVISRLCKDVNW